MDHAEPHELRLLEAGNHAQHPRLLAPLQLRLESHEAVVIAGKIVLAQLDGGVRLPSRPRILQPDRLHRPEAQRVLATMRHHFNRQAPFEELLLVEIVNRRRFGRRERRIERAVFVGAHRTVQVIAFAIVNSARLLTVDSATAGLSTVDCGLFRFHRDARNTFFMSIVSASTIGLIAS